MLYLLILFFAELFVSLKVGTVIGFGWSVVWILSTMILGALLLKLSPYALWNNFQTFNFGKFDLRDVHNASIAYMAGAILLIIPGVLTDLIGIALLLYTLYLHLFARIRPKQQTPHDPFYEGDNNVIDVEIIDEPDHSERDRKLR
ncbi:FxsA family protein [Nitratifractor salsuginis]|uniref:FxsA cytoplasmic membrane protein n=1 Tax=Nitratifractor salsuginis (strain DSM 16511 / JCM 12458 / E9I37-1) TaxID=749222 RepID=E6X318_NITSE|nr:FxsA family protein [Nitratifractor salsuginis]ADV46162.1 FxsA cytoplasmic membrane protein [Nitratifractor salsuginis DSM 16511]